MKLPTVYPLTRPSHHRTSTITAIVKSIVPACEVDSAHGMPRETRLNRDENIHCGSDVWRVIPSMRRGSASITRATSTFRARASQASTRREGKDQMRTTTSVAVALAFAVMLPGSGAEAFRTTVQAQSAPTSGTDAINPALLAGLKWRSIGPARGGRSQA